jgi:quinol monooxygenase YgiN
MGEETMSEPVVFVSHFRVKEGSTDHLRALVARVSAEMAAEKPRTLAYLSYLDEDGSNMTIVHVFPDAASMDRHFEGSEARSKRAYELVEPLGWEIYGHASERTVESMRHEAASAGVALNLEPAYLGGFLRLKPA